MQKTREKKGKKKCLIQRGAEVAQKLIGPQKGYKECAVTKQQKLIEVKQNKFL